MRNHYFFYVFQNTSKSIILTSLLLCCYFISYASTNKDGPKDNTIVFNVLAASEAHSVDQSTCEGVAVWSANEAPYVKDNIVQLDGNRYRANWWTVDNPTTNNGEIGSGEPWTLIGSCGATPNTDPNVAISSPAQGTVFTEGNPVTITANASDIDGTVTQVEFFIDAISIGIDTSAPFDVNWNSNGTGNHSITAIATDNDGANTTSSAVVITVNSTGPQAPVVNITSPSNNTTFTIGTTITIAANASDADGNIAMVEFFQGATKLGEDTTAPYTFNWSDATEGTYSLTVVATDNDAFATTSAAISIRVRANDGTPTELPERVIVGYWHNFDNGSGFIQPQNVSSKFDVVNISFAEPVSGSTSLIAFEPDATNITDSDFRTGIETLQSRGQEVVISIGGANGTVQLNTIAERDEFVSSMISIIENYGFDGMDIDFEGQSLALNLGDDDFRNPTTPRIVNLISAINTIYDHFGNDFILTMAPETFFVQLGYSFYGGISQAADRRAGAYLPVIHALRDRLSFLQVQYYNSGSITALDDQFYAMGNADFYVALVDMLLKGFPITGDSSKFFPALRQDQVLIGLPANFNAGGGFAPPAEVHKALDYLIKGIPFGGNYTLSQSYPNLRGLMTWSINWDAFNNFEFSNEHRAYFDALEGINPLPSVNITAPADNSNFVIGDAVNITADASDNGSVSQLEFFVDGTSLGVDTTSPYGINWSETTEGTHTLTVTATDNEGATATSSAINIIVGSDTPNVSPAVSLTSPSEGASHTEGAAIAITATATDTDGTIAQVEFFAGGISLGIDTTSPFGIAWNNASVGSHILTAIATDNLGATGNALAVTIAVEQEIISEGCEGIAVWSTNDTPYVEGNIVQYNGNRYRANFWTQTVPERNNGGQGSGQPWTLQGTCDGSTPNVLPTANISTPISNATFTVGDAITITASAADLDGSITQVEFFANGSRLGTDTTSPYSFNWTNGAIGNHALTVVAIDNSSGTVTSTTVNISISSETSNEPPSVSLTSPTSGTSFGVGNTITLSANASDNDGNVTLVEFFDGATKIGEDASAPYGITWSVGSVGNHTLTAKARDDENGETTSSAVTITITNGTPPPVTSDLAKHIMVGYWHNFDNGSAVLELGEVSTDWDVVNISFAEPATFGEADLAFTPNSGITSESQFRQDVALLQSRGQKVLISIGGANGRIELLTAEDAETYANAMIGIIENYGFDGMDIDLEGTSLGLSIGDNDFRNPTSAKITNFISGTQTILNHFGADFILSAAPETAFVQGGNSTYAGSFGAYLPVIYQFRNRLNYIHVQDYNSGCMLGLDGVCYGQGTADFHVAMTEMLLQGFPVAGHVQGFPALRPDQVAFGIPASPQAAGGGYTAPEEIQKALDYLIKGIPYGGRYNLVNSSGYSELRGLMTWSINWDVFFNREFSSNYRPYFDALLNTNTVQSLVVVSNLDNEWDAVNSESFKVYPNPTSEQTNLRFTLEEQDVVTLELYNLLGVRIKVFMDGEVMNKGLHEYPCEMGAFSKGVYFLKLKTNKMVQTLRILKN